MFTYTQHAVGGYSLGVRSTSASDKPVVILVHGIGVSGDYYLPFAKELAKQYRVLVLDLPGYGKTQKPKKPLTVYELGSVLAQYIREQELSAPVLIGHSMGCQIVANCAQNYPEMCGKYILLSPTVYDKERRIVWQALRLLQDSLHEPLKLNGVIVRDYLRMGMWRYLQTSRYMLADHIEDTLPHCMQPGLIIRGEKDEIVPMNWVKKLATLAPNVQPIEIPNAPHVVHYRMAREVADVCKIFI